MKRFEFKLQAVLTLRQRAEQIALEVYSRALQHRQAMAAQLTDAEMELSEARRLWLNELADGCPAVRAAQLLAFCRQLEERKRQCEQTLHLADVELHQASQRMLLARQEREAVEKLMTRQRERHDREASEAERRSIDDLAGHRTAESQQAGKSAGESSGPPAFWPAGLQPSGPPAADHVWN
jgi:flagellar FliJ protein